MTAGSLLVLALVTVLALIFVHVLLRWATPPDVEDDSEEEDPDLRQVRRHLAALATDDPQAVREAGNRLLSLGPRVIPALYDHLRSLGESASEEERARQGLVEEAVASFGLRAAVPLARSLRRVVFPSRMVPCALRVARKLGEPAIPALVGALDDENCAALGLVLHRCPGMPAPHGTAVLATLAGARLERCLRVFAGVLEQEPEAVGALYATAGAPQRRGLVSFYLRWPAPVAAQVLLRALSDPEAANRAQAALGVGLLAADLPPRLRAAADDADTEVRLASLRACTALDARDAAGLLAGRVRDAPPAERAEAALALPADVPVTGDEVLASALSADDRRVGLAAAAGLARRGAGGPGPDAALEALGAEDVALRRLAARCLGHHMGTDVRARERTFLLAEADDPEVRAAACAALAAGRQRDLPPLLARAVERCEGTPPEVFELRRAVLVAGDEAVQHLVRLVRTARPPAALLAAELVAAVGSELALDGLLRSLPHRRGDVVGMAVRSHVAAFGPAALEATAGLLGSELGWLPPTACEVLLQYGDASVCQLLLAHLDRSEAHHAAGLAALEAWAAVAPEAVLRALERGTESPAGERVRRWIGL